MAGAPAGREAEEVHPMNYLDRYRVFEREANAAIAMLLTKLHVTWVASDDPRLTLPGVVHEEPIVVSVTSREGEALTEEDVFMLLRLFEAKVREWHDGTVMTAYMRFRPEFQLERDFETSDTTAIIRMRVSTIQRMSVEPTNRAAQHDAIERFDALTAAGTARYAPGWKDPREQERHP